MNRKTPEFVVPLIVLSVFATLPVSGQTGDAAKAWRPDKKLVERLAKEEVVEGYAFRPPAGYRLERPEIPKNMVHVLKIYGWVGKKREDGTRPTIMVNTVLPGTGKPFTLTAEQAADNLLNAIKQGHTDWRQDKPEKGVVNGMDFVRVRWSGISSTKNRRMRGFIYLAFDGPKMLRLTSQDYVPEDEKSLPLAEASALTIRKK
jgi:hypothetical protein